MPDACCDVTYVDGRAFLTGPMTRARASRYVGQDVLLLQIAPAAARQVLGVPIAELTDLVIPLEELSVRLAHELARWFETDRLAELVRPVAAAGASARFAAAARALACGRAVSDAADRVALGERQLERLFHEHVGMAPKLFARIMRFRRALMAASAGMPLAKAAALHGYADQAHFSRDSRALTGCAPRALLPNVGNVQDVIRGEL